MSQSPFDKFKMGGQMKMPTASSENRSGGNQNQFEAGKTADKAQASQAANPPKPLKVSLPNHLYIPEGAQSLDLRRVENVPTGNIDLLLWEFVGPPGVVTKFIKYGVYNDGDNGNNYNFRPLVNNQRIFPYHGDPALNYKIYLGLGPDLSDTSMIPCQLEIQPGQKLQWLITNTSGVDTSMGVRMVGYFDSAQRRTMGRFGG